MPGTSSDVRVFGWDAITLRDNLMFATVFRDPKLCSELLEIVLGVPVERVVLVDTEVSKVPELGAKGIRMDVYVADGSGAIYDVEMQNANEGNLAKRSRYYLSANDMDSIVPGMDYDDMRDSFVIFVCSFDPFGRELPCYSITPCCREDAVEMPDGTTRVFVNATAWDKCADQRLAAFLRYLSSGTIGEDDFTRELDDAVQRIKRQPEWRRKRMKLERYLEEQRIKAVKEGLKEGREEGRKEGREEERNRIAKLAYLLEGAGRLDELVPAMADEGKLDALLGEFGIECDE